MADRKPPRLLSSQLTKTVYIVTRYKTAPASGTIVAEEKYPVDPRDLLDAIYVLGVSDAALDEVATALGFTRKAQP